MTEQRRIEIEVELPVTPEQAWEAVATGPGITAWFMPAEVDERVGGSVVHHHEADMSSSGTIIAYDAPRRFAYEEEFAPSADSSPHVTATEFLVEARSGGTCVVRVVMSGFGESDAWDRAIESFTTGWRQAMVSLRLYLTHFRGEPVGSVNAGGLMKGDHDSAWEWLTQQLGVPATPRPSERVATGGPEVPLFAGTVEHATAHLMTLILDTPARGIGLIGAGGVGDEVFVTVRAQLFGSEAAEVARSEQKSWKDWFASSVDQRDE